MTPAELLTSRLANCQERPAGRYNARWIALCPAHDDRNPSLAITEANDGRLLIKCYSGCGAIDIVQSVGLDLKDLFPSDNYYSPFYRDRKRRTKVSLDEEILDTAAGMRAAGTTFSQGFET